MKTINPASVLERYCLLRLEYSARPFERDPLASATTNRGDVCGNMALMCDVGKCLSALPTAQHQIIWKRWRWWMMREICDGKVARWMGERQKAERAAEKGNRRIADERLKQWEKNARRLTSKICQMDRTPEYGAAMRALEVELTARDLVGRTVCGAWCGIAGN